ncbi:MAG: hypothetical protein J5843_01960 [Clostridia bacterium]|nr:hypothetical protein [Clostridia bacterium]
MDSKRMDLHTHCVFSFDADRDATPANLCEAAVRNGIGILAVTDHYDIGYPYKFDPLEREGPFCQAKERYEGRVQLLRGIELGEMLDDPEEADRIRSAVPYDVVLGSLHGIRPFGDFCYLDYENRTDAELLGQWDRYREELTRLADEGDFDVLTHIRYPERYFIRHGRGHLLNINETGEAFFEPVFRALIRRDAALEINTSIVRKSGLPPDPGVKLLRAYRALGGRRITVGSDAHRLKDVGADIREALCIASEAGFEEVTVYEGRKPIQISIMEVMG